MKVKFEQEVTRLQEVSRRLWALETAYFEDYGTAVNLDSRCALEAFMKFNPEYVIPLLGTESTGHIVATWRGDHRSLTIRFTDRYRFDYSLSDPLWGSIGQSTLVTFRSEHPDWAGILRGADVR